MNLPHKDSKPVSVCVGGGAESYIILVKNVSLKNRKHIKSGYKKQK